ncbi:MAG: hypothetical protein JWP75_489 [Frondihabitans sp.]|nr:hypothetical protein [Frondihabitans sp.]
MRSTTLVLYVTLVTGGSLLTLDAVRRLITGHYLGWTIEVVLAVVAALLAHRVRLSQSRRRG